MGLGEIDRLGVVLRYAGPDERIADFARRLRQPYIDKGLGVGHKVSGLDHPTGEFGGVDDQVAREMGAHVPRLVVVP